MDYGPEQELPFLTSHVAHVQGAAVNADWEASARLFVSSARTLLIFDDIM